MFKTSFEIDQRWLIELAADRTPYIDQATVAQPVHPGRRRQMGPPDAPLPRLGARHQKRSIICAPSRSSAPASPAASRPTTRPTSSRSSCRPRIMTNAWRASDLRKPPRPCRREARRPEAAPGSRQRLSRTRRVRRRPHPGASRRPCVRRRASRSLPSRLVPRALFAAPPRRLRRDPERRRGRSRRRRASCSASGTASSSRSPGSPRSSCPTSSVYAVPNNGGWYDFGYFLGIVFLGVGARQAGRG